MPKPITINIGHVVAELNRLAAANGGLVPRYRAYNKLRGDNMPSAEAILHNVGLPRLAEAWAAFVESHGLTVESRASAGQRAADTRVARVEKDTGSPVRFMRDDDYGGLPVLKSRMVGDEVWHTLR